MQHSLEALEAAAEQVHAVIAPTLQYNWPLLAERCGCEVWVKHENHTPIGAFKVRGGVTFMNDFAKGGNAPGIITATRGNHGQSIGFAARSAGVAATIVVPEGNSAEKNAAMAALGVRLLVHGQDFDEAREEVERVGRSEGLRYVHSANEPLLIAGVGTMGLEIFDALPAVDAVIVPVGGGSGACGNALVARHINPDVQIIGVQTVGAPACYRAWRERRVGLDAHMETRHEGLATRVAFELTTRMMWDLVDRFELVSDEEIDAALGLLAREAKLVAEGAGAAALAAVLKIKDELEGKKVVGILSGGNVPAERLAALL